LYASSVFLVSSVSATMGWRKGTDLQTLRKDQFTLKFPHAAQQSKMQTAPSYMWEAEYNLTVKVNQLGISQDQQPKKTSKSRSRGREVTWLGSRGRIRRSQRR
jgi:hypothetical protein